MNIDYDKEIQEAIYQSLKNKTTCNYFSLIEPSNEFEENEMYEEALHLSLIHSDYKTSSSKPVFLNSNCIGSNGNSRKMEIQTKSHEKKQSKFDASDRTPHENEIFQADGLESQDFDKETQEAIYQSLKNDTNFDHFSTIEPSNEFEENEMYEENNEDSISKPGFLNSNCIVSDIFIDDGTILYNENADLCRKKRLEKEINKGYHYEDKNMSINLFNESSNTNNTSSSSSARILNLNSFNNNATLFNANASANANLINVNIKNINVKGVSAGASASATGLDISIANMSHTGVDLSASANATGAKIAIANVSQTGISAGMHASATGCSVKMFNISTSEAGVSASASVTGASLSLGNLNKSTTLCKDIELFNLGLNLGIPFCGSGSGDFISQSKDKYPDTKYVANGEKEITENIYISGDRSVKIEPNSKRETVDFQKNSRIPDCKCDTSADDESNQPDEKFIGYRGTASERNMEIQKEANEIKQSKPDASERTPHENEIVRVGQSIDKMYSKSSNDRWSGKYTTSDPDVASGYTIAENNDKAPIVRSYIDKNTDIYLTKTPLDQSDEVNPMLDQIDNKTRGKFSFGGPQTQGESDEFVTKNPESLCYTKSAHTSDSRGRLKEYHTCELKESKITPDYYVSLEKNSKFSDLKPNFDHVSLEKSIENERKKDDDDDDDDETVKEIKKCKDHSEKVTCLKCITPTSTTKIKFISKDKPIAKLDV